ncbi:MAG: hypothetical protein ACFFEY_18585 [Candidatus Thorarchaeota archaeon]
MSLNKFGKKYLLLGLRMGKLIDGFVDAYYGPSDLRNVVENEESHMAKDLLESCKQLQNQLNNQDFIEERIKLMRKNLEAIETSLNIFSGKEIPFTEKVSKIYDIKPELFDDSEFYRLNEELNSVFSGSGELSTRVDNFKNSHNLPINTLHEKFLEASKKIRKKTYNMFPNLLPQGEEISIKIVKDKPWGAYNWYHGNFKSRIDVNTDIPLDCVGVLKFVTHEAYPGHHTEHAIKEKNLYLDQKRFEHSILLIFTPEAVISEGIGNTAADVLFTDKEKAQFILDEICHDPFNTNLDLLMKYEQSEGQLLKILNNMAIYAHEDRWSDDELVKYALNFDLVSEKYIRRLLKTIRHPLWSTYVFNYTHGENLIKHKFGKNPSPKDFQTLLTHPILPSDLK